VISTTVTALARDLWLAMARRWLRDGAPRVVVKVEKCVFAKADRVSE
jgi:hypothetical protein